MTGPSKRTTHAVQECPVLSVSPMENDHFLLERILQKAEPFDGTELSWRLSRAAAVSAALTTLRKIEYPVVICERDIPLGGWKVLLEYSSRLDNPPFVIVASRQADEYLWAEALNLGAHDVLAKPFDPSEVVRVVSLACLRWYLDRPSRSENKGKPGGKLLVTRASYSMGK